jgi:CHAD domain-containing protein
MARRDLQGAFRAARHVQGLRGLQSRLMEAALFRKSMPATSAQWRKRILRGAEGLVAECQNADRKDLHRLRKHIKRCRYAMEALGASQSAVARQQMKALQTTLGNYCDARLAAERLNPADLPLEKALQRQLRVAARRLQTKRRHQALRAVHAVSTLTAGIARH